VGSETANSLVVGRNTHQEAEAKVDRVPWSPLECDSQCCVKTCRCWIAQALY